MQEHFDEIIFVGDQVGHHQFKQLKFYQCANTWQIFKAIKTLRKELPDPIFYGDFYLAYIFVLARVPYYFTFHDNWPELRGFGWKFFLQSLYFVPIYRMVIRRAEWTFAVSAFKQKFINRYTHKVSLVRNGIRELGDELHVIPSTGRCQILMLGNIDERKYLLALKLFEVIEDSHLSEELEIHIYGHQQDRNLAKKLAAYSFVRIHGFSDNVSFESFHLMLSTSAMENLSIAVVESLVHHVPVLAFDVGGLKEVVKNGLNGFLVPVGDFAQMFSILEAFARREVRDLLFEDHLLVEFNWDVASEKYRQIMLSS